jgi:hypothetical protein
MTLHTDFWVVVGTASPVFLLAAIVTTVDSLSIKVPARAKRREKRRKRMSYGLVSMTYFSMVAQAIAFTLALNSLAAARDVASPKIVANIEFTSLLLWLGSSAYQAGWRDSAAERNEKEQKTPTPEQNGTGS